MPNANKSDKKRNRDSAIVSEEAGGDERRKDVRERVERGGEEEL